MMIIRRHILLISMLILGNIMIFAQNTGNIEVENGVSIIERIEAELPATKERDEIILFVRNSKRGIIKGY